MEHQHVFLVLYYLVPQYQLFLISLSFLTSSASINHDSILNLVYYFF